MSDEKQESANDTRFKPGNKFWLARSSHGRNPKFAAPEILWSACCEYFQWAHENPLFEEKAFAYQGIIKKESVAHPRVMTLTSLCLFLHIMDDTWRAYRDNPDFLGVCSDAEKFIREQKFAGAATGQFNPMIIARDLGLRENAAIDHSSSDGSMATGKDVNINMTAKEAAEAFANTLGGNE